MLAQSQQKVIAMQKLKKLLESAPQILQDTTQECALERAKDFCQNLLIWNATHNLSGAKQAAQVEANIIDSLLPFVSIPPFSSCLDVGSGAGFPALVMALARPKVDFHLCEPRAKRVAFLSFVATKLGLENLHIHKSRIQSLAATQKNLVKSSIEKVQSFELITSRALMDSKSLILATREILEPNGHWLFFKGSQSSDFSDLTYNTVKLCARDLAKNLDFGSASSYNSERIYLYIQNLN